MPVIPETKVSKRARDFFEKGRAAMERNNHDYAIDMFRAAVETEPGFMQARKFLRATCLKKYMASGGNSVKRAITTVTSLPLLLKGWIALKRGNPDQAMLTAETLLAKDPLNMVFIKLLGQAAEASGMPEIAIQTLEIANECVPDNPDVLMWLGDLYMKTKQLKEAQDVFSRLSELKPHDGEVKRLFKNAMAAGTLSKGWSQTDNAEGSYGLARDAKETAALEQQGKLARGEEGTELLINETLVKIEKEPKNLNYRRSLAGLYTEARRFDEAVEALREIIKISGDDPQTERAIADVQLKKYDYEIKALKEKGDMEAAESLKAEKSKFQFENTRNLVERYPNDLNLRYQYGVKLFENEMFNEAIREFQQAQKNSKNRASALYYLGMCFEKKEQFDFAREQLEKALAETGEMNDLKKGILYELGQVAEAAGENDVAVNKYYKEIYQADIGYRDVATRIEQAYRR